MKRLIIVLMLVNSMVPTAFGAGTYDGMYNQGRLAKAWEHSVIKRDKHLSNGDKTQGNKWQSRVKILNEIMKHETMIKNLKSQLPR